MPFHKKLFKAVTKPFKQVQKEFKRYVKGMYEVQKDVFSKRSIKFAAAAGTYAVTGSPTAAAVAYQAGASYEQREILKGMKPPPLPPPLPRAILAGERAAMDERDRLKRKKRKRLTVMGGRGELTLGKPGLLGV